MAAHSSILALENPMDRGAWRNTVHEAAVRPHLGTEHTPPTRLNNLSEMTE